MAVGRLAYQKGFERLLNAFADLAPRHTDWSLVILGEGSLRGCLTEQATQLGLDGYVAFPGAVGNVGEWFAVADAYVMTSRFEGFPNTLLEAMAHGVPSVVVDCLTGPRELIETEVNGLLVPEDDPTALITALDRLMVDPDLRMRLATRAIEVRKKYSVEQIAAHWEHEFQFITHRICQ
ncbi:MAG: glycosyltransferase [Gammaproteobacteria bacterium]|nr:glycosyltransferase [Gammaproteobacteria bacterium]